MKLVLVFVILVSSPFAFSQTAGQVRELDNKVKSFFKITGDNFNKECQKAKAIFSGLSQIVVRDVGYSNYDITGTTKEHPHVWMELRSNDDSCKYGYFDSTIVLPASRTRYIQTRKEKPASTLDEDVTQFFTNANKPGNGNKICLEAEAIYKKNRLHVTTRDLGNLNFFITGKTVKGELVSLELDHNSEVYNCDYKLIPDSDSDTSEPESSSREVCGYEYTCGSGYYTGMCGNNWVCRRY
jgi:hypothetical protein